MRVYEAKISYALVSLGDEIKLDRPERVVEYLRSAYEENPLQEAFYVVFLNRKNVPIGRLMVSLGTLTSTLAGPREVFRGAILAGASAVIVSHNHPSGDPAPSAADVQITRQLRDASRVIDIDLIDHVVVGHRESDPAGKGYYSFREAGVI